jgi:hypothetical protein
MTTPSTSSPAVPTPYRSTLFDRKGPAAVDDVRAYAYGIMVFAIIISAWLLMAHRLSLGVILAAAMLGTVTGGIALTLSAGAGAGFHRVMMSGASTPYEEQFSYQESLVMRGLVGDALASYEAIIAERPAMTSARLRAAALYASRGGNPRRAAELLRAVMSTEGISARDDIAASNRLIELLMGPLGEPGRAMVELRRLMDRHPGTDVAGRAKLMLAELKEQMTARAEPRP